MITQSTGKVNYYGLNPRKLKGNLNQLEVELLYVGAISSESLGGLSKAEHIKNVIKILYPWVHNNWHEWNELTLWAWCTYNEIGLTGCASAHKTFTITLLNFIEWLAKPTSSAVALTSTSIPSLRARIWAEVKNFFNNGTIQFEPIFNIVDSRQQIQAIRGEDKFSITGIAVDKGNVKDAIGKIQGRHPDRMMIVVDEAAQTPAAIFTARANLQSGTSFYRFAAIANAVDQYDAHGIFCEPKNGWTTISVEDEFWETRTGICIHYDGTKSPNVRRKSTIFPKLFSQKDLDKIVNDFGENSLEYWSYGRGFWPPTGVRQTVLDAPLIANHRAQEKPKWESHNRVKIASLDPAFTTGGDKCVFRLAEAGNFLTGEYGLHLLKIVIIKLRDDLEYPISYQIADEVIRLCLEEGVAPENFIMDDTAGGGGPADILSQKWSNKIIRISFGGAPFDGPVSFEDSREAKNVFYNRVTQLWFTFQKLVLLGLVRGLDAETAKEFTTRRYSLKKEKTILETKPEYKKRTNGESPDFADATSLLGYKFYLMTNKKNSPKQSSSDREWANLYSQFSLSSDYDES